MILKNQTLCNKLTNKALEQYSITIEEILRDHPSGRIGKTLWNNYYVWCTLEAYQEYRDWCLRELDKVFYSNKNKSLEAYNEYELALGLKETFRW